MSAVSFQTLVVCGAVAMSTLAAADAAPAAGDSTDPATTTTKPATKPVKKKPKPTQKAAAKPKKPATDKTKVKPARDVAYDPSDSPSDSAAVVVTPPAATVTVETAPAPTPVVAADPVAPVVPVDAAAPPPSDHSFYFRAGVAIVAPVASSQPMQLSNISGAASLAVQNGPIVGSGASVSPAATPAAILGWFIPGTHHKLAIETVLGLPFKVTFNATGTLASQSIAPTALGIPTDVPALGPKLGDATAAPPVITLVYMLPKLGPVQPLVGAGFAVLFASGAKVTNPILTEVTQPKFSIDPAPGFVLQAGADVPIWKRLYLRVDVKFIAFLQAKATVSDIYVNTPGLPLFQTVEVGDAKMNVTINPFVIEAGLGWDFF